MSYISNKDFFFDAAKGIIPGHECMRIFAKNASVGTTEEDVWVAGGTYNWLTTADNLRIKSGGNAADTAAGAGARSVELKFLDSTGLITTETLSTAGTSASSSTASTAIRLISATVMTSGTYTSAATAAITIETDGGTIVGQIDAVLGMSRLSMYSVPLGKTAYMFRVRTHVDGSKNASIYAYCRQSLLNSTAPVSPRIRILIFDNQSGGVSDGFSLDCPLVFPALTDIWWAANTTSGTSSVSVAYELILVDD